MSARPCDALNLDGDLVESDDDCSMSFVVKLVAEPNSGGALHGKNLKEGVLLLVVK